MRHALSAFLLLATALPAFAQVPKAKSFPPDAAAKATINAKLAELRAAAAALATNTEHRPDVTVYLTAVERALRLDEWLTKDAPKQAVAVLDAGLKRAAALKAENTPWRDVRGKSVVRGYVSRVDGTVQPYALTLPMAGKVARLDVVLHGRDGTLSEVKFLAQREAAKPSANPPGVAVLDIFGRGNNAYRWAGETDVTDAMAIVKGQLHPQAVVLRGFSMGGAGTWQYGLHHPFAFRVLGPGAGFTTTRGYAKLPDKLPDWQERCLTIYDAVDVAENVFDVPVVAYSGGNDKQKAAADNIIAALKDFKEPYSLTHLVAPGLEHKMPPEWQAKPEAEYAKHVAAPRPTRTRYVLYTTAYQESGPALACLVLELESHYKKATVEIDRADPTKVRVKTTNVTALAPPRFSHSLELDGQTFLKSDFKKQQYFMKSAKKWMPVDAESYQHDLLLKPRKWAGLHGPIDDAFMRPFAVGPAPESTSPVTKSLSANRARLGDEWERYLHGQIRELTPEWKGGRVLFGTPETPAVAAVLPKLPITWTADKLTVKGIDYDAKSHYPAMIYPDPANPGNYVVLNTGHTFHAKEFEGSNALLYPRLGDWAVLKLTPTATDPAATETVASGLFDENWQFEK
jgi:hypothetical protein